MLSAESHPSTISLCREDRIFILRRHFFRTDLLLQLRWIFQEHLVVAAASRDHRITILIGIGRHIHDDGFIGRHRFFQNGIEVSDLLDP